MKRLLYTITCLVLAAGVLAGPWIDTAGWNAVVAHAADLAGRLVAVGPWLDHGGVRLAASPLLDGGATARPGMWEAIAATVADLAGRVVAVGPMLDYSG